MKRHIKRNSNYNVLFRTKDVGKNLEKYCGPWNCETRCGTQLVTLKAFKLHRIIEGLLKHFVLTAIKKLLYCEIILEYEYH